MEETSIRWMIVGYPEATWLLNSPGALGIYLGADPITTELFFPSARHMIVHLHSASLVVISVMWEPGSLCFDEGAPSSFLGLL